MVFAAVIAVTTLGAVDLQERVDQLGPGEVLALDSTVYAGPVVIDTPLVTLQGQAGTVIDGGGQQTVVTIRAPGVELRDLEIRNSGRSTMNVDAGVRVHQQPDVKLLRLTLLDVAFGFDISESRNVEIISCDVTNRAAAVTARGDAIRIFSSEDVTVSDTHWRNSRDAVAWYSRNIRFERNRGIQSRYSLHLMYSENVFIENNYFEDNSVGIFIMYGKGVTVLHNEVQRSRGPAGIGIGLKETAQVYVEGNAILSCATGLVIDNSPWGPDTLNWFHRNLLSFNGRGILLANDRPGNQFIGNVIRSNTVSVESEDRKTSASVWAKNYWDDYEGFDLDDDGLGDTPHRPKKFGDLLTGEHPSTRFFVGSPVLGLVNLIERLVPITDPLVLLEDPQPLMEPKPLKFGLEDRDG
ncbi:MAG: nitrous oxide reductase family maturation protein NosD [Myxococcota bacterium]